MIDNQIDHVRATCDGNTAGTFGLRLGFVTQTTFVHISTLPHAGGTNCHTIEVDAPSGALGFPDDINFNHVIADNSVVDNIGGVWAPLRGGIRFNDWSLVYSGGAVPVSTAYGNFSGYDSQGRHFPRPVTWTPADGSGASLSLTASDAYVWRSADGTCHATANITYPTTANASNAVITGLPSWCYAYGSATAIAGGAPSYSTYGAMSLLIANGTGNINIYNPTGTAVNNSAMSTQNVRFELSYRGPQ
jgi:hypothetical protein